ncbi:fumarate hydratase C-terminal domain-containing protein [Roseococcus suduntuyensis]|uniref:L(+)-tartrate dehydratase beta subunit n=1 Tax=Roseococcus suduntuyensis TaxID=455361 RepID=A0A840AF20_9PROT|nr:fumarate hydratase C-terminal domain-containing protein [Roseococcus suduntuyensis]MBB3899050.1 L(+)-tartrate dehydratase beta subunit [Roseococcus suduntuyensis]
MAHHILHMPATEADIRKLRVGDTVTLQDTLFGIRDATQIHMFDRGRRTRFDLNGHAVIHTAPNVRKVDPNPSASLAQEPATRGTNHSGYEAVCIGTTTSDRMERFTRPLMEREGVRIIIGKGGLREDSARAFQELGGCYLAVIGGAAALETTWITAIEDVDMDDLNPESLWRFAIRDFGPLIVGMDSHGGSLYRDVQASVEAKRAAVLAKLGAG